MQNKDKVVVRFSSSLVPVFHPKTSGMIDLISNLREKIRLERAVTLLPIKFCDTSEYESGLYKFIVDGNIVFENFISPNLSIARNIENIVKELEECIYEKVL